MTATTRGTLIVFARQPLPGRVKTRLAATIGAAAARDAYIALAHTALDAAARLRDVDVELCVDGDLQDAQVQDWARRAGARLVQQGAGDLGARMHRALARGVAPGGLAVLIGTDCPGCDAAVLDEAFDALHCATETGGPYDAVFAPAEDGGYALVGVTRSVPALFDSIEWSTPAVMSTTRERCRALGLRWLELRTLWDVDDEASLARWQALGL